MEFLTSLSPIAKAGMAGGVLLLGGISHYLIKSGLFVQPKCSLKKSPAMRIAYKMHSGSYSNSGTKCDEVANLARSNGGSSSNHIVSVYFDDPYKCPAEYLRYAIGCRIEKDQQELEAALTKAGYKFETFPACKCVYTSFPCYSMLSIILAVRRVYGPIYDYAQKQYQGKKCPNLICFEVYPKCTAEYYVPVDESLRNFDPFFLGQEQDMDKYATEMKAKKSS